MLFIGWHIHGMGSIEKIEPNMLVLVHTNTSRRPAHVGTILRVRQRSGIPFALPDPRQDRTYTFGGKGI